MFWNKKEVVEVDGLPITLSKRQAYNRFTGAITNHFLAYKNGNEWKGLVGYEQFREEMDEIRKKQELILDHLKLKYIPETEIKEPARLVQKTVGPVIDFTRFLTASGGSWSTPSTTCNSTPTKPKKKRGRPKKK